MTARIRQAVVLAVGLLIVLSVGLSAVPLARRLSGDPDTSPEPREDLAAIEPEALDLAPILGLAPFGSVAAPPEQQVEPTETAETALGLVLLGVTIAVPAEGSRAIIGGGTIPVASFASGAEVSATARLVEVHSDHVVLDVGGRLETLSFDTPPVRATDEIGGPDLRNLIPREEEPTSNQLDPANVSADGPTLDDTDADAGAVLAGYLEQFEEDPGLLLDTLGLTPTDRGYQVAEEAAPVIAQAGLRPGDLVTGVNGQKVGDMVADQVYLNKVAASGRARVEIERDGETIVLTFPLQ